MVRYALPGEWVFISDRRARKIFDGLVCDSNRTDAVATLGDSSLLEYTAAHHEETMSPLKGLPNGECLGSDGHLNHLEGCDRTRNSICRQIRKRDDTSRNHRTKLVRIVAQEQNLIVPELASDRLSKARAVYLGWTDSQWRNVEMEVQVRLGTKKKKSKITKSYDDSFIVARAKRGTPKTPRKLSEGERKKSEYLEAELQKKCIAYAEKCGCRPMIVDNDNNPDTQYWYKTISLGFAEFKSPTGRVTGDQEKRIKELRDYFGGKQAARVFNCFGDFKIWLNTRIAERMGLLA